MASGVFLQAFFSAASFAVLGFFVDRVDLGERHDLRLVGEFAAIGLQFLAHGLVGLGDIFFLRGDQMQEHAGALDMAEEAVAKPDAFMRAFDEARNIGNDELAPVDGGNAKVGVKRRERIVGDLRPRGGDAGEKRRFAGIRQADKSGIGDQLQPQPDGALLAFLAGIGAARAPGWSRS